MGVIKYIPVFAGAFALSLLLTPVVRAAALKFGIVDRPDKNLKSHSAPVAYFGGIAIFLSFLGVLLIVSRGKLTGFHGLLIGSGLIFALGLIDDMNKLSVSVKFFVQASAAIVLVFSGIKVDFFGNPALNIVVSVLWTVGITNAFNLLDIMDGLSSGVAIIAGLVFFALGFAYGKVFSPSASLALAGACLGFLVFNFPPAKIFMGDAGSLFIGFMLAALSMTESYSSHNKLAVLAPLLILGVPLFDTLFVMWMRWRQGKPVYYGSPDHFPLRLRRAGLSLRQVLFVSYSAAGLLGLAGFAVTLLSPVASVVLYAVVLVAALFTAIKLSKTG